MRHGKLLSRLDALESKLISPLQRRLETLTPADRAAYETWKRERIAWSRQFAPGEQFAAYLRTGRGGPQLARHVERQLFPGAQIITSNDNIADAAEKYRRALEGVER
ncbi:hypothetical protein [Aquamicrobium defluvii]|uniref:Uncharacterized protein n=1 Tax=Aquamicrobium defluvii TaxID=69279 RepID=A0A4R6Y697_9HYPH|nr:hypothetical protein [Aquamicrobium defluvii]TDR30315.1 hypothetical protein DES43_1465 [Aquamicrobium defluvii]